MKTNVSTRSLLIALVLVFLAPLVIAQTPQTASIDTSTATTSQTSSFAVGEGPEA